MTTAARTPAYTLSNGLDIPAVGLGMDQVPDPAEAVSTASLALALGYRSIDTASAYGNEAEVGLALRNSEVPREDVYLSTKLDGPDHGYDRTLRAFDSAARRLKVDYIDM